MTRSLTIRRNMHGETISSGVVAPCGGKYTGTAVALKSGNSCIRRVRMIIPAVPFFDFTTNTIYAAVLRSVQAYGNSDEKDGYCGKAETSAPHPDSHCLKTTAAQLLTDAVPPQASIRTYSHNNQVTGTASVSLPPDTNTAEAEGPGCKNPNLNKTNGDQRANCHGLFTEGRDAGHTSPHPVITAGTTVWNGTPTHLIRSFRATEP